MRAIFVSIFKSLSAVTIIFSLLLLIIEIQENTRAVRYQLETNRIDRIRSAADSDYIPGIVAQIKEVDQASVEPATRALMDRYGLSLEDADRFSRHLNGIWEGLQADYRFGIRDARYVNTLLRYPDQALFWQVARANQYFDHCFTQWVDDVREGISGGYNKPNRLMHSVQSFFLDYGSKPPDCKV